jgi:hypothetical protein
MPGAGLLHRSLSTVLVLCYVNQIAARAASLQF